MNGSSVSSGTTADGTAVGGAAVGGAAAGGAANRGVVLVRTGGVSLKLNARAVLVGAACAVAALVVSVFAIGGGDYPLSFGEVVRAVFGHGDASTDFIVNQLRLPRAATALAVGAALGLAGALFQSLARNPLGSPDLLGFTQGSTMGVLVAIVLLGGSSLALAAGAVIGGVLTGVLIVLLVGRNGAHGQRLVLVGVGIAAILTGVNGYLLTKAQITEAARAVLWLTGSLDGRDWKQAAPLLVMLALAGAITVSCGRAMRTLEMGDEAARALGVPVDRVRGLLLAVAVLLAALAAAAAGPVSFVALTAPQPARRLTRASGPNALPSACLGAAMLAAADLAGQRLVPGHQLPVGVVTGLLGGGYLIWLLSTERKAGRL
ncbi:FecCD family ABC transporter permease [Actinomadura rupiterrae]|uniref:FecCD family ABC transporter permease n=1 Tax=Actinomadura rupiterrae TaxID=559627 RepID=UPI0020A4B151|nr:iron chelate uptake ABC transporter family permease subunit [Actinomadura rupiterrae]MCP2338714.1 iron complex transport system permease protein [Actinomadura rupiterrae]